MPQIFGMAVKEKGFQAGHYCNRLTRKLGIEITDEVLALNADGQLYENVVRLAHLTSFPEALDAFTSNQESRVQMPEGRLENQGLTYLLGYIMRVSGLADEKGTVRSARLHKDTLKEFSGVLKANRVMVEDLYRRPLRKDLQENPTRQLNAFLSLRALYPVKELGNRRSIRLSYGTAAGDVSQPGGSCLLGDVGIRRP